MSPSRVFAYRIDRLTEIINKIVYAHLSLLMLFNKPAEFCTVSVTSEMYLRFLAFIPEKSMVLEWLLMDYDVLYLTLNRHRLQLAAIQY